MSVLYFKCAAGMGLPSKACCARVAVKRDQAGRVEVFHGRT